MKKHKPPPPPAPCMKCGRTDHKDRCSHAECEYRRPRPFDTMPGYESLHEGSYRRVPHFDN